MANIEAKYHLDEPLIQQYGRYLWSVVRGDLGPSYKYKDYDVNYYISMGLPKSMGLGTLSLIIAIIAGMSAGMLSALRQNTWVDYTSMAVAVLGISVPPLCHRAGDAMDFRDEAGSPPCGRLAG